MTLLKPISYEEFQEFQKQPETVVIDSREGTTSIKGFLKGSYLIPLNIFLQLVC